jgi:5'-AMP-activated protein kinase catalytic alpha subunit
MPKFLSSECKDFIKKILNTDPEGRFRIQDIRNHDYMTKNLVGVDPIPREPGLFPGLQKMPWEQTLLGKLIEDYQFEEEYAVRCMEANRHNHITATYHLINKKNQRNKYMRETFSTHRKSDVDHKRDRMQSQGVP